MLNIRRQQRFTEKRLSLDRVIPGRFALWWVVAFTVAMNVLLLFLPFYWIQVFDRVITSGSVETLIGLTVVVIGAMIFSGLFDTLRTRLLSRFAVGFENSVAPLVLTASIVDPAKRARASTHDIVKVRELRNFLSSATVPALIDAPFLPAFVAVLFLIHPWFGTIALIGVVILAGLAVISARIARAEIEQASDAATHAQSVLDGIVRHANLVRAMGWTHGAIREFMRLNDRALAPVVRSSERVAAIASTARVVRSILQILAIAIGAWLLLQNELLAGGLIAGSIILNRTLQPVEGMLAGWRALTSAYDAWACVRAATAEVLADKPRTLLPAPKGALEINRITYTIPNARRPILAGVSFRCAPADIIVVIGPTGAGKSTLLKLIAGLERPTGGAVLLDRASLNTWDPDQLGKSIGYLPQDIELLGGTVAEAIAGFDPNARDEDIVAAAMLGNAHDMILALPNGYETDIGRDGRRLSGGQRQHVGLARAFFGSRRVVLLDEPNSNLDPEGEEALCAALKQAKARGTTLVIVTHRPRVLTIADFVLLLRDGVQIGYGTPSEILPQAVSGATPMRTPRVVSRNTTGPGRPTIGVG